MAAKEPQKRSNSGGLIEEEEDRGRESFQILENSSLANP